MIHIVIPIVSQLSNCKLEASNKMHKIWRGEVGEGCQHILVTNHTNASFIFLVAGLKKGERGHISSFNER